MNQKLTKIRSIIVVLVLIASVSGLSSCDKYSYPLPVVNPDIPILFQTDIQSIFNEKCVTCHNGTQFPNLTQGKAYSSLTKSGLVDLPGETSRLYVKITSSSHTARSTDTDKQKVLNWINQGALNN